VPDREQVSGEAEVGLTRSQARRIEDVLAELDVDQRSWSEVERDALQALNAVAESASPLPAGGLSEEDIKTVKLMFDYYKRRGAGSVSHEYLDNILARLASAQMKSHA
jgi:hypothetical protein